MTKRQPSLARHPASGYGGQALFALDRLTPEQVAEFKRTALGGAAPPKSPKVRGFRFDDERPRTVAVAEGDSWFDFPVGTDIIDCLRRMHGFRIENFARRGDTLENMVFGNNPHEPDPLTRVIDRIREVNADVFLFSGGGNDVVGPELEFYLNHSASELEEFRIDFARYLMNTVGFVSLARMIRRVTEARPNIQICAHGYGYPYPSGKAVEVLIFRVAGPWIKPAFDRKGIAESQRRPILKQLVDGFNDMLESLAKQHDNFHYINLRDEIKENDWRDELHLKSSAFARVAARFAAAVNASTA